jgi:hypothetical protein
VLGGGPEQRRGGGTMTALIEERSEIFTI